MPDSIETRVRGLETTVAELQVLIEERLSSIARDISDIRGFQVASIKSTSEHGIEAARHATKWETHDREHQTIMTDITNLYTKANRNAISIAKFLAVGGGSGIAGGTIIYALIKLLG